MVLTLIIVITHSVGSVMFVAGAITIVFYVVRWLEFSAVIAFGSVNLVALGDFDVDLSIVVAAVGVSIAEQALIL